MNLPHLGVGEEDAGRSDITLQSSSSALSVLGSSSEPKEHNYMGLSDCSSSVDSSAISITSAESRSNMSLKATELRLGLPGSQSPERDAENDLLSSSEHDERPLLPLHSLKDSPSSLSHKSFVSGSKRGFSDAMSGFSEGKFNSKLNIDVVLSPRSSNLAAKSCPSKEGSAILTAKMEAATPNAVQDKPLDASESSQKNMNSSNQSSAPVPKAQVVGWPPIRSFRKNSLATTIKNGHEINGKSGHGALFIKVSMDGAPYLRKVDLKAYATYRELSSALETMFSCFTIGQFASHVTTGKEMLSESNLKDLVHGSEYVLTYEDKDGDWMLVGDVPWEMFIDTCKRLRIMKSSDAIGLAPRAIEKCRSRS